MTQSGSGTPPRRPETPFFNHYHGAIDRGLDSIAAYFDAIRRLDGMCYHPECEKVLDPCGLTMNQLFAKMEKCCPVCGVMPTYRTELSIRCYVMTNKPRYIGTI